MFPVEAGTPPQVPDKDPLESISVVCFGAPDEAAYLSPPRATARASK